MKIGGALALIALGAILKFAVAAQVSGVDLGMIGIILMAVGAVGLVLSLVLMSSRRRTDVVHEPGVAQVAADGSVVQGPSRTTVSEPRRIDPAL